MTDKPEPVDHIKEAKRAFTHASFTAATDAFTLITAITVPQNKVMAFGMSAAAFMLTGLTVKLVSEGMVHLAQHAISSRNPVPTPVTTPADGPQ